MQATSWVEHSAVASFSVTFILWVRRGHVICEPRGSDSDLMCFDSHIVPWMIAFVIQHQTAFGTVINGPRAGRGQLNVSQTTKSVVQRSLLAKCQRKMVNQAEKG